MKRFLLLALACLVMAAASAQVYSTAGGGVPAPRLPRPQLSTNNSTANRTPQQKQKQDEVLPDAKKQLSQGWYITAGALLNFNPERSSNGGNEIFGAGFGYMHPFLATPSGHANLYLGGDMDLGYNVDSEHMYADIGPFVGTKFGFPGIHFDLRLQPTLMYCPYYYFGDYWDGEKDFFGFKFCIGASVWFKNFNVGVKWYPGDGSGLGVQMSLAL